MIYHGIAFLAGFILDLILGDPYRFPHPIRLIGKGIAFLEEKMNRGDHLIRKGACMTVIVLVCTAAVTAAVMIITYLVHPAVGIIAESILTWYALAAKSLWKESGKVYLCLREDDTEGARKAVSLIVGRDTDALDEAGITRAAVETVAENTSDGVIAPMIFLAIGGPVLGLCYKAVNTMDSMVGYKNERYLLFGRAAAKLDDIVNFIPSRISACLMTASCLFLGKDYSAREAWRICKRDRRNHASPNSAQTEAVCAGALGIRLAGDASYFGKTVKKPYIGDDSRPIECKDIKRANRLMYGAAALCEIICLAVFAVIAVLAA